MDFDFGVAIGNQRNIRSQRLIERFPSDEAAAWNRLVFQNAVDLVNGELMFGRGINCADFIRVSFRSTGAEL